MNCPVRLDEFEVSVTSACNLRCTHCSVMPGRYSDPRDLSLEKITGVLHDGAAAGATRLDITGGEPTVRPDLEEIVRRARTLGFNVKLLSNGTLLTPERLRSLHEAGLSVLAVSIDGSTRDVHAATHTVSQGMFERSLTALKEARKLGLLVKVNTVVSRRNLNDLPRLVALVKDIGCFEHRLCSLVPTGWGATQSDQTVDPLEWIAFIKERLAQLDTNMSIYASVDVLPRNIARRFGHSCLIAERNKRAYVSALGEVYPCPFFCFANRSIGNVRDRGFGQIVNSKAVWDKALNEAPFVCPNVFRDDQELVPVCPCRKIRARSLG